jgi:hypothetical protein
MQLLVLGSDRVRISNGRSTMACCVQGTGFIMALFASLMYRVEVVQHESFWYIRGGVINRNGMTFLSGLLRDHLSPVEEEISIMDM